MDDEYITREDAMWAACKALCHPGVRCPDNICAEVRDVFDAIPAADVRPVVRCKDCAYHYYAVDCAGMCKLGIGNALLDDDFCSRGIRKCGADMREVDDE